MNNVPLVVYTLQDVNKSLDEAALIVIGSVGNLTSACWTKVENEDLWIYELRLIVASL